jgi:hypothetical protein
MFKEMTAAKLGDTIHVPVEKARDHVYLRPDTMSAATSLLGDLELMLLSFRTHSEEYTYEVIGETDETKSIRTKGSDSSASMVEVGVLRLTPSLALDCLAISIEQLIKGGVDQKTIGERLLPLLVVPTV